MCEGPEDTIGLSWSWPASPEDSSHTSPHGCQSSISAWPWDFSPCPNYITGTLVGSSATTKSTSCHRCCWSRPGSPDWLPSLAPHLPLSHQLAWWSELLPGPVSQLLVCIAGVWGNAAGCVTLSSRLPVPQQAASPHWSLAQGTKTSALWQPEKSESHFPVNFEH